MNKETPLTIATDFLVGFSFTMAVIAALCTIAYAAYGVAS